MKQATKVLRSLGVVIATIALVAFLSNYFSASQATNIAKLPWQKGISGSVSQRIHDDRYVGKALDIRLPAGTPVLAPADVTVVEQCNAGNNHRAIKLRDSSGDYYSLIHVTTSNISIGKQYAQGEQIGVVATDTPSNSCARSTSPHLHMGLPRNPSTIDGYTLGSGTALNTALTSSNYWLGNRWQEQPGSARDIGVGANGSVWVVGNTQLGNGGYTIHQWNGSGWNRIGGAAVRIDVGASGNPWIVNGTGNIYERINGRWEIRPGSARDIGVGKDGSVWIIGNTRLGENGYTIHQWNGSGWNRIEGAAIQIDVGPSGNPWIVNGTGSIYERINGRWEIRPGSARDISIGTDASVWIVGNTYQGEGGYSIHRWNGNSWDRIEGSASRISAGSSGNLWIVNSLRKIYKRIN